MSDIHYLTLPLTDDQLSKVKLGDMVYLTGDIVITIGLPTHQRIIDNLGDLSALPPALPGGAFFHLSSFNRESEKGFEALYLNPSTSTRYNQYMPAIIRGLGLKAVGGKGGLDQASVEAMKEAGCIYLSFLGGGCTPLSKAIREVKDVHWHDYISQFRLLTLHVENLGPATVAIDKQGNSLYASLRQHAEELLPELMAELNQGRAADLAEIKRNKTP